MRIETVNVLKRHPPHQRADHISSPPIGLQHSEKIPHPKAGFCLILKNVRHTKLHNIKINKKLNNIPDYQVKNMIYF